MKDTELLVIAAMTREWVIGDRGRLPWRLPDELRLFRQLTLGHAVVMGRKTFLGIGRPLPGRRNFVLSSTLAPQPGIQICRNLHQALAAAAVPGGKIFVIGGAQVYREALLSADTLHVSWVRAALSGDTLFPRFDGRSWQVSAAEDFPTFRHVVYRRYP